MNIMSDSELFCTIRTVKDKPVVYIGYKGAGSSRFSIDEMEYVVDLYSQAKERFVEEGGTI